MTYGIVLIAIAVLFFHVFFWNPHLWFVRLIAPILGLVGLSLVWKASNPMGCFLITLLSAAVAIVGAARWPVYWQNDRGVSKNSRSTEQSTEK